MPKNSVAQDCRQRSGWIFAEEIEKGKGNWEGRTISTSTSYPNHHDYDHLVLSLTSPLTGWSTKAERFNTAVIDSLFRFCRSYIKEPLEYWSAAFQKSKANISSNAVGFQETIKESGGNSSLIKEACEKSQEFFAQNPKVAEHLIKVGNTDKQTLAKMLEKTNRVSSWVNLLNGAKSVSEGRTLNTHSWESLVNSCQNNTAQFPGAEELRTALLEDSPVSPYNETYIKNPDTSFNQALNNVKAQVEKVAAEGNKLEVSFEKEIKGKQEELLSILTSS